MTTEKVATRLVALCRTGQYDQAYTELFGENAVSQEPAHSQQPEAKGLDALKAKGAQFANDVKEIHDNYVSDPLVAGNHFTCTMAMDLTMKDGNRMKMEEVCVYEVKDGKVVKEQFFY